MQSRTFTVKGIGGKDRPMFVGTWMDDLGYRHTQGMPDLLAFPVAMIRLDLLKLTADMPASLTPPKYSTTVPLWIECKAGKGTLTDEQKSFRDWALAHGHYHIEAHDSCEPLLQWFKQMGVVR